MTALMPESARSREAPSARVTVVLITRNQAWNVRQLVDSVVAELPSTSAAEVILVDSASTDGTVELVHDRPITIVRLRPDQRLTAAAGRYVGNALAKGDLTLFLDGDMQLASGWLEAALEYLLDHPDVAVVTGTLLHRDPADSRDIVRAAPAPRRTIEARGVRSARGAGMYRRAVLDQVGSFRPYVYSDEEPELCIRIRAAGHRIACLEMPIAYHFSDPREEIATLLARRERRLFLGAGQNLRYLLRDRALVSYVRERGFGLVTLAVLAVWLALVAWSAAAGRRLVLALAILVPVAALGVVALRRRSVYRVIHALVHRLCIVDGTLRGFLMTPLDPATTPVTFDVLRTAEEAGP